MKSQDRPPQDQPPQERSAADSAHDHTAHDCTAHDYLARDHMARDHMAACPVHALRARLRGAGLRPTRQRIALGWLLLGKGPRHVTAESLFEEARDAGAPLSLATVYNALRQFTDAGLLREIAVEGARAYFDTNTAHHHHFLMDGALVDIREALHVKGAPQPPEGMEIDRIDIVIRLKPKGG